MLIFLANVGRAIYLLKITYSQLESEVSSYTEEDEFCFFGVGRRRKALMLPSFWVILYISQVILSYLPCKKQQAVVVLLLIAAVIKTLQLERSGRLWWWIKQQRAYLTLLSSYCLTCTHINRILIWLLSWVKHKDFRKKQLISWAKKPHHFNMLTFWFRTTLKFLIMIHFFFFFKFYFVRLERG